MSTSFKSYLNNHWSSYSDTRAKMRAKVPFFWHSYTESYQSIEDFSEQIAGCIFNPLSMGIQAFGYLVEGILCAVKSLCLIIPAMIDCLKKESKSKESFKEAVAQTMITGVMSLIAAVYAITSTFLTSVATLSRAVLQPF